MDHGYEINEVRWMSAAAGGIGTCAEQGGEHEDAPHPP